MRNPCSCVSHNRPDLGGTEAEVVLPFRMHFEGLNGRGLRDDLPLTVSVDPCIADVMQAMWRAGIETAGCCCGHRGAFGGPSVIIVHPEDAADATHVLEQDCRAWQVMFWAGGDHQPDRQIIDDEAFHDDDIADEPDAWPHGWWVLPAALVGLLFWAGIIIAMVFWIASLL